MAATVVKLTPIKTQVDGSVKIVEKSFRMPWAVLIRDIAMEIENDNYFGMN